MAVYSTSHDLESNVQVILPSNKCCNCGGSTGLSAIATDLKKARVMVLAGTEITLKAHLPYCHLCTNSRKEARWARE
jgi:hypothetical protein